MLHAAVLITARRGKAGASFKIQRLSGVNVR
jgi:hypothetical protein